MKDRPHRKYIYYVSSLSPHHYFWCSATKRWVASKEVTPDMEVRIHRRCRTMKSALRCAAKLMRLGIPGINVQIDRNGPSHWRRWCLAGERECGASA